VELRQIFPDFAKKQGTWHFYYAALRRKKAIATGFADLQSLVVKLMK